MSEIQTYLGILFYPVEQTRCWKAVQRLSWFSLSFWNLDPEKSEVERQAVAEEPWPLTASAVRWRER